MDGGTLNRSREIGGEAGFEGKKVPMLDILVSGPPLEISNRRLDQGPGTQEVKRWKWVGLLQQ